MKTLKMASVGLCLVLAAMIGVGVLHAVTSYDGTLTSFPLRYIICGYLLFGLLGYGVIGLAYAVARFFIKKR